jgi:hypothetical protein
MPDSRTFAQRHDFQMDLVSAYLRKCTYLQRANRTIPLHAREPGPWDTPLVGDVLSTNHAKGDHMTQTTPQNVSTVMDQGSRNVMHMIC